MKSEEWVERTKEIIEIIESHGGGARYVGGCVRDSIIGRKINDIDIATNLLPEQVIEYLTQRGIKTIPTGLKHGTITAMINKIPVEITTLRRDIVCDGRHAEVAFTAEWIDDAKRRDFTFNALYMDKNGEIYDYFNGINDLKNKELRFVGDSNERITEDYLRILRVFRFHTYLCDVDLSKEILNSCSKHSENINILSGERIQVEMIKLLSYPNAIRAMNYMIDYNILDKIIPNADFDLEKLDISLLKPITDPILKLALILRTSKNKNLFPELIFKRWKFSKKHYSELEMLTNFSKDVIDPKYFIIEYGKEFLNKIIEIYNAEHKISNDRYIELKHLIDSWEIPAFTISGNDLIKMGVSAGKDVGFILRELRGYWHKSNYLLSKEELLSLAIRFINNNI